MAGLSLRRRRTPLGHYSSLILNPALFLARWTPLYEHGISLPNNQRQHRTSHAPKDVLPLRICANYCAPCQRLPTKTLTENVSVCAQARQHLRTNKLTEHATRKRCWSRSTLLVDVTLKSQPQTSTRNRQASSSSSSLTSTILKSDQPLTTHRLPSTGNRAPLQTS